MRIHHLHRWACAALIVLGTVPSATGVGLSRSAGIAVSLRAPLAVFHLHRAALPVTFSGMSGTVDLDLLAPEGYVSGLRLDTPRVTLDGVTATRDVVVSAPGLPEFYTPDQSLSATYTLVVRQGGHDLAQVPVQIEERLLDLRIAARPAGVRSRAGDPVSFTLEVQVTPPLDGPVPVTFDGCAVEGCEYAATPLGVTTATGPLLRRQFTLTVPRDAGVPAGETISIHQAVAVGEFAGYRRGWYGTPEVTLAWTAQP